MKAYGVCEKLEFSRWLVLDAQRDWSSYDDFRGKLKHVTAPYFHYYVCHCWCTRQPYFTAAVSTDMDNLLCTIFLTT